MTFDELNQYSNNPSRVIPKIFNDVENTFLAGSGTLNSADHPFPYMVDLIIGTNYGLISRLGDIESKQFRVHARTIDDLSKTMSDDDWYGVFASPSTTTVSFIISEESLDQAAIRFNEINGTLNNSYRKLVIPPDTKITIAGIPFLLENPVEIRVMDHGGYGVVYDSTRQSKLNPLVTNTPEVHYLNIDRVRYLALELPVRQLELTPQDNKPINANSGFKEVINYTDTIYAVRAFITPDGSTTRSEMAIIYNNKNYDPNQVTLVIDLKTENSFEATVPPVYIQNGMITSARITILVYTTKGILSRDLSTLQNQYFEISYYDYANDNGALNTYEKPFATMVNPPLAEAMLPITGGRNALTFQQLKDRMIYGYRQRQIPISNSDISQSLLSNGYSSIKSIDMITDRLYRVTRDLPIQANKLYQDSSVISFNSSMGTSVGSVLTSMEDLIATGWGIDNGRRVTLLQGAPFNITKQTPYLITKIQYDLLMASSNQTKIDTLADQTFVYTPFTYVIDTTKNRAVARIYRTNSPTIKYQTFRFENPTLGLQVSVGNILITYSPEGYQITIQTSSSDAYKSLANADTNVQLSFTPSGVSSPITMKAALAGVTEEGERQFVFTIPTRFDITDANLIGVSGFNQFGQPANISFVDLITTANFIFTYGGTDLQLTSDADKKIDQTLFNKTNIAIIETEYAVEFGRPLASIYTRIRPMTGEGIYQKYANDIPATYATDIYKYQIVEENGVKIRKLVLENGLPVIEHHAGEQQVTEDGTLVWKYHKGQTVYDSENKPVLLEPRKLKYYWDFIGFDFNYVVSQDAYDTEYMKAVENFFVDEVVAQLDGFNKITLDETKIVFKPKSTMGFTNVIINEAVERIVKNDLTFSVIYLLTTSGMRNENLKSNLTTSTHTIINDALLKDTISHSDIVSLLKNNGGNEVVDVSVVATAGTFNIDAITNVDPTNGFSVRKEIEQTADKFLTIKEAIEIQFKRHLPNA